MNSVLQIMVAVVFMTVCFCNIVPALIIMVTLKARAKGQGYRPIPLLHVGHEKTEDRTGGTEDEVKQPRSWGTLNFHEFLESALTFCMCCS